MWRTVDLAWRNIGRNRRRSILSMVAVAVATMAIVFLFSYIEGMKQDMATNLIRYYNGEIRIRHGEYGRWEHLNPLHLAVHDVEAALAEIDRLDVVAAAVPRLTVPGAVFRGDQRTGLQITGVDFTREAAFSRIDQRVVSGTPGELRGGAEGVAPESARGPRVTPAVVGSRVMQRLGLAEGDDFTVVIRTGLHGTNAMTFRAVAVVDFPVSSLNEVAVWAPLERVQHLARMTDQAGEVLLQLDSGALRAGGMNTRDAVAVVERAVGGGMGTGESASNTVPLEVQYWRDIQNTYQFMEYAQRIYTFVALVFFLLAATVIVNTTMMVIFERRREIGTLSALGMDEGRLVRLFFTESAILGFLGALTGLGAGVIITLIVGQIGIDFGAAMEGIDMEISTVLYPKLNLRSSLGVFLFSFAVSAATSYLPTRRITRIQPIEALRDE